MPRVKKSQSARKTNKGKKAAKAVVKAAKYLMLKDVETKHSYYNNASLLDHNLIYTVSPTQQLVQGNTATTRIGDSILLESWEITGFFQIAAAKLNCKFRMLVGWSRSTVSNTNFNASGLGISEIFYNSGGYNSELIVNPKLFQVLSDDVVDINSNTTTGQDLRSFRMKIKFKHLKFDYAGVGSTLGKNRNLFFVVIPCNSAGTAGNVGAIQGTSSLRFKDP